MICISSNAMFSGKPDASGSCSKSIKHTFVGVFLKLKSGASHSSVQKSLDYTFFCVLHKLLQWPVSFLVIRGKSFFVF